MKAPVIWLKDFTDIDVSAKELGDALTMSGSKVEEIIDYKLSGVVAGKILSVAEHPDSDHLHILKVDLGDKYGHDVQIVCGAPNVYEGMLCPVATVGAELPEITIKKGKIRGVESFGMCCSGEELGACAQGKPGADVYGLWDLKDLDPVPEVGTDLRDVLNLDNLVTLDFEITSNRPDCFSIEGLGRETAVTLGHEFRPVDSKLKLEGTRDIKDIAKVDIEAPDLCYRYCSRIVEDVVIGPSPDWMAERLLAAGMRPINNIVDITNYVCLELGQPMHAFDLDYLANNHIIVRRAKDGEIVKTLDNNEAANEHVLTSDMLVIADEEKICALAGVMGGSNSEVLPTTKEILFESATFNGVSVRRTAIKNGLRTEASSRYEKGLDPENAMRALDRACELVELLGAGKVCQGVIDNYPTKIEVNKIPFRPAKINEFLGINAEESFMVDTLKSLGCTFEDIDGVNTIVVPSYRPDLVAEADIAEEVARFYGYNKIEATLLSGKTTTLGGRNKEQQVTEKIRNTLVSCGFFEAITYSFESPSDLDKLRLPADSPLRRQVVISNPLGDDSSVMRTSMIPSMLRIASRNANRGTTKAGVFEAAYVYLPDEDPTKLPYERRTLCGFFYNTDSAADSADMFYHVKGVIEELLTVLGIRSYGFEQLTDNLTFHPGRTATLSVNGREAGVIGVIHPETAENFDCPEKLCIFDIDIEKLIAAAKSARVYKPLPRFPAITRDLSLIVDRSVEVGQIIKTAKKAGGNLLKEVNFLSVYEDFNKLGGKKAVAISLVFRADDKTLNDSDITPSYDAILDALAKGHDAKLR